MSSVISALAQADDVMHASNTISNLNLLATLTEAYCRKYRVKLVPSKTKLLAFYKPCHQLILDHAKLINPITIDGVPVKFSSEAEHVGVILSTSGNMPNLLNRITSHKKSMSFVLSAGLARGHHASQAAALRVHQLYGTPVLDSSLASQVLSRTEIKLMIATTRTLSRTCSACTPKHQDQLCSSWLVPFLVKESFTPSS